MPTPIENLLLLQEAAQSGAVPPDVAAWFDRGIEEFLSRQGPLDECLNLTGGPGMRKALTVYLIHRRDYHLRQAWLTLAASSPWKRSVALAGEIKRFEARVWPRWRDLSEPPPGSSDLRTHLFHAFRAQLDIPKLTRLHSICSTNPPY